MIVIYTILDSKSSHYNNNEMYNIIPISQLTNPGRLNRIFFLNNKVVGNRSVGVELGRKWRGEDC